MHNEPMTKDEQAVLFNRILKNQMVIMNTLLNQQKENGSLMNPDLPEAIEKTRDDKRLVQFVE